MNTAEELTTHNRQNLIERAQQELSRIDFGAARATCAELREADPGDESLLFSLCTNIRIDVFTTAGREIDDDLTMLELLRTRLSQKDYWPLQWYLLAWFTAPQLAIRPVDPFYLFNRCVELPDASERQSCLVQAMHYGVLYSEHHFIAHLNQHYPFDDKWLASTYHRATFNALRAAYARDGSALSQEIRGLKQAAGTPLQYREIEIMETRYSHFLDI